MTRQLISPEPRLGGETALLRPRLMLARGKLVSLCEVGEHSGALHVRCPPTWAQRRSITGSVFQPRGYRGDTTGKHSSSQRNGILPQQIFPVVDEAPVLPPAQSPPLGTFARAFLAEVSETTFPFCLAQCRNGQRARGGTRLPSWAQHVHFQPQFYVREVRMRPCPSYIFVKRNSVWVSPGPGA
jgi:hypothetical protein